MKVRGKMKKLLNMKKIMALLLVSVFIFNACSSKETPVQVVYDEVSDQGTTSEDTSVSKDSSVTEDKETQEAPAPIVKENEFLTEYPYTFTDKFGNEVTIEQKPATVVSFSPEITETLFAIGAGDRLVGRSTYGDYPAEALDVPDLGTLFEFNLETLVAANPDVVFLSSMVSEDVYQQMIDNGLTVVTVDYDKTLAGTMTQISLIGDVVDRIDQANEVNGRIQDAIDDLGAKAADRKDISMYFVVSAGEYTSTATGDTFLNDIIQTVGITNIAADGTGWAYTLEQIVEKDPYFMVCSNKWDTKAKIESLEGYKDLTAVKEGRLYQVDENIFYRQGPRVVEAMYVLDALASSLQSN